MDIGNLRQTLVQRQREIHKRLNRISEKILAANTRYENKIATAESREDFRDIAESYKQNVIKPVENGAEEAEQLLEDEAEGEESFEQLVEKHGGKDSDMDLARNTAHNIEIARGAIENIEKEGMNMWNRMQEIQAKVNSNTWGIEKLRDNFREALEEDSEIETRLRNKLDEEWREVSRSIG